VPESLKDALAGPSPLTGTVLTLPGATAAELLAEPFDLVWIDLEHAALGPLDAQEMILGAQAAHAYVLVRIPAGASALMTVMLDAGADGIVLADVTDGADAATATERVLHPPDGVRGWGPRRLTLRGRSRKGGGMSPSIWAQIESATAVDRAGEIAAVAGIDALVVGTADLSFSLGVPLDGAAPELSTAIAAVRTASAAAGAALGVAGAIDQMPPTAYAGASVLVHSTDARICARAVDETASWLRSAT
jgi:2-keto-3-deoxy-L-rhamnonate aldolase RhmA